MITNSVRIKRLEDLKDTALNYKVEGITWHMSTWGSYLWQKYLQVPVKNKKELCGTNACLGGHYVMRYPRRIRFNPKRDLTQQLGAHFGLRYEEAMDIFLGPWGADRRDMAKIIQDVIDKYKKA